MKSLAPDNQEVVGCASIVGVDPRLLEKIDRMFPDDLVVDFMDDLEELFQQLESGDMLVDAVVLGMGAEDAVRAAQRINTYDKLIPVLILAAPAVSEELKRTLLFSPFLGNEVAVWPTDDMDILPAALRDAVIRRRQRLRYRDTLSNAQIRLEKFPLQKPEATHYLDRLLDYAPVGVVTVDLEGTITTLNRRAQELLTSTERPVLGQPLGAFFAAAERERLVTLQERCAADDKYQGRAVLEIHSLAGEASYIEVTIAPLAYRTGQRGFMLILQDVTSRVEAEEDMGRHVTVLRKFHGIISSESLSLEEKLDEVLCLGCEQFRLPVGVLSRIDGSYLDVLRSVGGENRYPAGARYPIDQTYCGKSIVAPEPLAIANAGEEPEWADHPAHRGAGLEAYIGTVVQVDEGVNGTLCFLGESPRNRPFTSADNELLKLMSRWVASELQRERADARMRKLSGALEQTADIVTITDRNRYIEYVNPAFERLTGYAQQEVLGRKTHFLRSGFHNAVFYNDLNDTINKGEVYRGTLTNRKKDGTLYYEQKTISPLKDRNGEITHFISTGRDITALLEAEEKARARQAELTHVARLSTLGEMTSGLAHELNQPLCAITTYAQGCLQILQRGDCEPERVRYGLKQVVKQAELAGGIFRHLRDFARKGEMHRESLRMAAIIEEVLDFVSAEARQKMMDTHVDLPADLPPVYADSIQVEQVLLNLVRNAFDALAHLDAGERRIFLAAFEDPAGFVTVEFRDTGPGCPAGTTERLFDPFVTSKPEGLGIGLSISQSIIESHGGKMWLAENSAGGAVFRFTLPVAVEAGTGHA
ncbi:MAG: PAS domain S-box protein [Gammaproteobacteria bacterium]|nr:PAS domain S-box protein [Gammaproteobacteria bacterium]